MLWCFVIEVIVQWSVATYVDCTGDTISLRLPGSSAESDIISMPITTVQNFNSKEVEGGLTVN